MKIFAFVFFALIACSTSFAETISLVCEHDGGVSTETGLTGHSIGPNIFMIEFDAEREKIITEISGATKLSVNIFPVYISWSLEYGKPSRIRQYKLNRYTGTLYLTHLFNGVVFVATGKCVANGDKLF